MGFLYPTSIFPLRQFSNTVIIKFIRCVRDDRGQGHRVGGRAVGYMIDDVAADPLAVQDTEDLVQDQGVFLRSSVPQRTGPIGISAPRSGRKIRIFISR